MVKSGFGKKNGSQKGKQTGGQGRNKTTKCRNPSIKKGRQIKWENEKQKKKMNQF